jgi:hypothetical protein
MGPEVKAVAPLAKITVLVKSQFREPGPFIIYISI